MTSTQLPADERARLATVHRYEVLDTPAEAALDRITTLAARLLRAPIALITIVDGDRIWFKSRHGLPDVTEVGREPGLCASAIVHDGPYVVNDARVDPRTKDNTLVTGPLGVRFYAGVPLTAADGHTLGTLCVLDREPREVTDDELATLVDLAALVMDELELRQAARDIITAESQLRREAEQLADTLQASLLPPRPPSIPGMDVATRYIPGERLLRVAGDFFDVFRLASNEWGLVLGDACGKGPKAASLAALARWSIRAAAVHESSPSDVLSDVNDVLRTEGEDQDDHFCSVVFGRLELDVCGAWLTVASSGHLLPMLVRASGKIEERGYASLPIGMFDVIESEDDRVGLGPGDALVFFTDGITEARDGRGVLFGDDGLADVLRRCVGCTANEMASEIVRAARKHAADRLTDDVAVMVVRVPEDAGTDPVARVVAATGMSADDLRLPGYPHDTGRA